MTHFPYRFRAFMSSLSWECDSHKGQLMLVKRVLWVVRFCATFVERLVYIF